MNTNRDGLSGADLRMPSGSEVESATFHAPVGQGSPLASSVPASRGSAVRGRLDDLRSRGVSKLHDVQRLVSTRSSVIRSNVERSLATTRTSVRSNVNTQMTKMQSSMAFNPAKWAGIAAGSGFVLGMIGRAVHWRNKHHRHRPEIVIIDAMC